MPEFTLPDLAPPKADPADCIVLEGVAHVFGGDDLTDQIVRQATIPDWVTLLRHWDTRSPIGIIEAIRVERDEIWVRAQMSAVDYRAPYATPALDPVAGSVLATCHHLALAVRIVGKEGDASTMDYVSVVDVGLGRTPTVPPYRLTWVPEVLRGDQILRKNYVHVEHGTEERRTEWWHRDDPVLTTIFPPER